MKQDYSPQSTQANLPKDKFERHPIFKFNKQSNDQQKFNNSSSSQDQYITPKKKSIYAEPINDQQTTAPKHKYKYTITQTPIVNKWGNILFIIWIFFILLIFLSSIISKYQALKLTIAIEIENCQIDFIKNKCENPYKDLKQYCLQKKLCMNSTVQQMVSKRIKITYMVGEILKQFVEGTGIIVLILGFIFLWGRNCFSKDKVVKKEYIQYK